MTARRTKIVATIGPASDAPGTLRELIAAGMDMARLSLSHGSVDETVERVRRVRAAATEAGRHIGILADLPGPKVRADEFAAPGVHLVEGSSVELAVGGGGARSDDRRIGIDHGGALDHLRPGDRVALGDGAIQLEVTHALATDGVLAQVVSGGWAQGRPGVALPPGGQALRAPTDHDLELLAAIRGEVDAVAVSFVRSADDVERARAAAGDGLMVVAKIETPEAVDAAAEVIAASDGVMVARGDLGIRCALEDVPLHQKHIIRTAVTYGRPVITATQVLESMVRSPVPTRAEVSDIANAVFDGTSALMLSGETAIGSYPVAAVATMARVASRAEREFDHAGWGRSIGRQTLPVDPTGAATAGHDRITAAVSAAGWRASLDADVSAVIACTNSGATARAISRFRPAVPILGVTPSQRTARQLSVAWGITPMLADRHGTTDEIVWFAVQAATEAGHVRSGDVVAVLVGSPTDPEPATDTLRLVRIS